MTRCGSICTSRTLVNHLTTLWHMLPSMDGCAALPTSAAIQPHSSQSNNYLIYLTTMCCSVTVNIVLGWMCMHLRRALYIHHSVLSSGFQTTQSFLCRWQAHKAAVRASSRLAARQPPGVRLAFPGPYAVVPGMIGGDLDRLPVPGLGPRDPLRQWALPGTGLPQGPVLRDPFAPPRRGRRSAWQLH